MITACRILIQALKNDDEQHSTIGGTTCKSHVLFSV